MKSRKKYSAKKEAKQDIVKINGNAFNPFDYDNWVGDGYPNKYQRVKDLQSALSQAYYSPGPIDGNWGPNTKTALVHMQKDRGLVAEGICNTATWKILSKP
jgi:peptidoglycan hydrolase-like protein with peptidoglycan-binding domain